MVKAVLLNDNLKTPKNSLKPIHNFKANSLMPKSKLDARGKVCIHRQTQRIKKRQELRSLYKKLREIVPSCKTKPVSFLDIVLNAVDYINELHEMLDKKVPGAIRPYSLPIVSSISQKEYGAQIQQDITSANKGFSFRDVTNVTMSTTLQPTEKVRN